MCILGRWPVHVPAAWTKCPFTIGAHGGNLIVGWDGTRAHSYSTDGLIVLEISLGSAGMVTSVMGLGTGAFGDAYGPASRSDCIRVIEAARDNGIAMLDTADFYAGGDVERMLGASLGGRRGGFLISTHGGVRTSRFGSPVIDGSPAYLAMACDASLRRLRTDCIDLYYLSGVDPVVPVEESVGKLGELITAGKIRYIGMYRASGDDLRRAQGIQPISALAVEYSLRSRAAERDKLVAAVELGVGAVAYCPLARGLLGGGRPAASAQERDGIRVIEAEAAELDIGMARLALAWLLRHRGVVAVPGTRSPAHLEMNASAAGIWLDSDICSRLDRVFPP
jgi:aryl-alcohol dehydrogenase-like predicted oxidoreductase